MRRRETAVALALVCAAALSLAALVVGSGDAGPDGDVSAGAVAPVGGGEDPDAGAASGTPGGSGGEGGRTDEGDVAEAAADLLEERRSRGDCVLVRSGYLDLLGGTWGCVLQGNGWVEVCLVSEGDGGEGCDVVTWRMDAADAARVTGP